MPVLLKVRGVGASKYESGDFALLTIYISGIDKKGREACISITCKLQLVDRLKVNMLVYNNMLCTEGFTINFSIFSTFIYSCNIEIDINVR